MKIQIDEKVIFNSNGVNVPLPLVDIQNIGSFEDYMKKSEKKEEEKKYESKIFVASKGIDLNTYEEHLRYIYNQSGEKWGYQRLISTKENAFENAPEFEAVYNRWIAKGDDPTNALLRAKLYAQAGLISYGDQKAIDISEPLEPGDKMQHGLHLIHNDLLKQTLAETFEKLDINIFSALYSQLFSYDKKLALDVDAQKDNIFQALLDKFGSTIQPLLKDESEPIFDGNINITDEMDLAKKDFIYKTLIQFFEYNLNHIKTLIENAQYQGLFTREKEGLEALIDNFKKNIDKFNQDYQKVEVAEE